MSHPDPTKEYCNCPDDSGSCQYCMNVLYRNPKYYIEVDCGGAEASGFEDRLPWVCYGTIVAEGNSLTECLESASVDMIDQDGGERGQVEADAEWMQDAILEAFSVKYTNERNSK